MRTRYLVLIALLMPGFALADDWDDFTNNLATDLAPLISLFGEQVTKQFLSESLNILDNYIFALAPLGILTAVVSVIRVCGNSSLRAFIGRAHEGPGEAEHSLLSCVSETTAELFNDGGISRVFGRPKILEIVTWEDDGPRDPDKPRLTTLHGALEKGIWKGETANAGLKYPDFDIPNLSLNKGIKRRSQFWFSSAALIGSILQIGTIVFAAITVFTFPQHFKKNGTAVANYAFPLFFVGTFLLCVGMFLCAFIIERSSIEYYYYPQKKSKIFWLQPGGQEVGDQVFGAFLGVREGPDGRATTELEYIKSLRNHDYRNKDTWLLVAVSLTMIGFVCQFVGLRGLHSSITLVQLGSTMLMAVIRTSLRMERTDLDDNLLSSKERTLASYNKQELDCFAFHLENVKSLFVSAEPTDQLSCREDSDGSAIQVRQGRQILKTRAHLALLSGIDNKGQNYAWDDLPIRKVAMDLKKVIETTMEVVVSWAGDQSVSSIFYIVLKYQSSDKPERSEVEKYSIILEKLGDWVHWKVDAAELEAVLGLWTWSLLNSDERLLSGEPLYRIIGQDRNEAMAEEAELLYYKWIFRQTQVRKVTSENISLSRGMFGYLSNDSSTTTAMDVFAMETHNTLCTMAAQDIYIYFLNSLFSGPWELGGELEILQDTQGVFIARNSRIEELVHCFEASHLGSREDALLCIVLALRRQGKLPPLSADSTTVRQRIQRYIDNSDWDNAFVLLRWLCHLSEEEEFERSINELGYLCCRAMLHYDASVREKGFSHALMDFNLLFNSFQVGGHYLRYNMRLLGKRSQYRDGFFRQLRWVSYHIAKQLQEQSILNVLRGLGTHEDSIIGVTMPENTSPVSQLAMHGVLHWLTKVDDDLLDHEISKETEQLCLDWLISHEYSSLLYWVILRWIEIGKLYPPFLQAILQLVSQCQSDIAIQIIHRHGADMNASGTGGAIGGPTALIDMVAEGDEKAVLRLLRNGADANAASTSKITPIFVASHQGNIQILDILLQHGASIDASDSIAYDTALNTAACNNHLAVVKRLLVENVYIDSAGINSMTPLLSAVSEGNTEIAEFLMENGANINARNGFGYTALILAVQRKHTSLVSDLLRRGCDVHAKDDSSWTAFDWARSSGREDYMALLQSAS